MISSIEDFVSNIASLFNVSQVHFFGRPIENLVPMTLQDDIPFWSSLSAFMDNIQEEEELNIER